MKQTPMVPQNPNSPQPIVEEILATARHESGEIVRRAKEQAQALLAKAVAEADKLRQDRLAQARAEADRRTELMLATVPVEAGRARSARIEVVLDACREAVRQRLQARVGFDYREALIQLAVEAVGRMAGEQFVVKLSPADHALYGAGLAEAIANRVNHSPLKVAVTEDLSVTGGGPVVEDGDGRQVWDNRLEARLERLWPGMRRQLAGQAGLVDLGHSEGGTA